MNLTKNQKHNSPTNALFSPLFIVSLIVFIINDHHLKYSGHLPAQLTGKLSDIAFFFFFPIAFAVVLGLLWKRAVLLSYLFSGLLFAALNLSSEFSSWMELLLTNVLGSSFRLWPDVSDLWVLATIPISYNLFFQSDSKLTKPISIWQDWINKNKFSYAIPLKKFASKLLVAISLFACLYSSRVDTHEPIYMKLSEFRKSASVSGPDQIETKGKIVVMPGVLYVSEPGVGIHIIDTSDKKNPKQVSLIKILGNVDLAIKGNVVYADSLIDLLIIDVSDITRPIIVDRVFDQFSYDPLVLLPDEGRVTMRPERNFSQDGNIIVGWKLR